MVVAAADDFDDDAYERKKRKSLDRELRQSLAGRDIGPPPKCKNTRLKSQVSGDLEQFLLKLFPDVFKWTFSEDQKLSIQQMDSVIDRGGLQAVADPRGTGKTQRAVRAAIKAILTGKRKFVCIVAATDGAAKRIIRAIKTIVSYNTVLYELFPKELHGFPQLRGNNRKAGGQLCEGIETAINLGAEQIIFPTIKGSKCSGAIISSCGITGNVRGQFHTLQDGSVIRPDLVLVDDPQTKESAKSPQQTQERLEIIEGDVLGLAGPDTAIACMVLCTVIAKDDLSERLLQSTKWHGRRTKTIYEFPKNMKAWDQYFEDYEAAIRLQVPEKINEAYLCGAMNSMRVVCWHGTSDSKKETCRLFRRQCTFGTDAGMSRSRRSTRTNPLLIQVKESSRRPRQSRRNCLGYLAESCQSGRLS